MPADPQQISDSPISTHLDTGNGLEQLSRLRAHTLCVLKMAGIVIGHFQRGRPAGRPRLELGQHLRDVAALRGKRLRARRIRRIVSEQVPVPLHRGSTPGRVDHDGIDLAGIERIDQASRELHRVASLRRHAPRAHRSTAGSGNHHLAALRGKHARRRAFTLLKKTRCTQPSRSPTRLRWVPCAGMRAGSGRAPNVIGGSNRSIA